MAGTLVPIFDIHPALTGFRAGDHKRFGPADIARKNAWLSRALIFPSHVGADPLRPGTAGFVALGQARRLCSFTIVWLTTAGQA